MFVKPHGYILSFKKLSVDFCAGVLIIHTKNIACNMTKLGQFLGLVMCRRYVNGSKYFEYPYSIQDIYKEMVNIDRRANGQPST